MGSVPASVKSRRIFLMCLPDFVSSVNILNEPPSKVNVLMHPLTIELKNLEKLETASSREL